MSIFLEFLEKAGIKIEDNKETYLSYSTECKPNSLHIQNTKGSENEDITTQNITVNFDNKENKITIKDTKNRQHNFRQFSSFYGEYTYRVDNNQTITEFKVANQVLWMTRCSINQGIREDTLGGGDWIIVNFDTLEDFKDEKKLSYAIARPDTSIEAFEIPANYHIKDGIKPVGKPLSKDTVSIKVKKKK